MAEFKPASLRRWSALLFLQLVGRGLVRGGQRACKKIL
jgi:hypothetical protein